ncbi:hypothetical protein DFQ26_005166 [Actinomortierella ambigua]|nr:hypothetical protein DFQ26_005166 [Actinomortierella ambigua]
MAHDCRPISRDGSRMNIHHINQGDHGGRFALLTATLHNNKQLIRTLFMHIVEGRLRHPAVSEAVRQRFLDSPEYHQKVRYATRYESEPSAGGIEIVALCGLPAMPLCRQALLSSDGKWLIATFNRTKYWLPIDGVTHDEVRRLMMSATLGVPKLCIDIAAHGPFYTIQMDGGMGLDVDITKTMERADFLLGAMAFGRDARTGVLFEPKQGQLPGYKNPVLETERLLQEDSEYAALRCQYIDAWVSPTLVFDTPFSVPESKWYGYWPQLEFPKPCFRVTWRLVHADLFRKLAYYDVPDVLDDVAADAMVLLRPYLALIESVRKHGAEWIASEADLRKVSQYAKVFQVLSLNNLGDVPRLQISSSATVYERAEFRLLMPESTEIDVIGRAMESAYTTVIVSSVNDLTCAAQYCVLGFNCFRQKKFHKAALHYLQAVDYCLKQHPSGPKPGRTEDFTMMCLRESCTSILECIYQAPTDWVTQKDESKYPLWWKKLQEQFGQALQVVTSVLKEPGFTSMDEFQLQVAVPFVVDMLLVNLAHGMLTVFEKIQSLEGILGICHFMERLYKGMKDPDIPLSKDGGKAAGLYWSSAEHASLDLTARLFTSTNRSDPFKVLEQALQDENDDASPSTTQQGVNAPRPAHLPFNRPRINAQTTTLDSRVMQAERPMDAYFIQGDFAASLACALMLVESLSHAEASAHADRIRLWAKARLIAECAFAQWCLFSAKQLLEGVESVLNAGEYKLYMIKNKTAMLTYLAEASAMLTPCKRLFPKASGVLQSLIYDATARVHRTWSDDNTASKWTAAAEARRAAVKSRSDDIAAIKYACHWLLDDASKKNASALKCTKEWQAMVATLVSPGLHQK